MSLAPRIRLSRHQRAFTLTELLVVIGIVLALAAIATPSMKLAMSKARRSQCMQNEKQIAAALFLYAGEHNNMLPAVDSGYPSTSDSLNQWPYAIWTYCGYSTSSYIWNVNDASVRKGSNTPTKKNVFRCPEIWGNPQCPPGLQVNANRTSYGLNSGVGSPLWLDTWNRPTPLASITAPSRTAMLVEASFLLGTRTGFALYWGLLPHDGGLNVAFYDGHIQYMKYSELPTTASDPFWNGM